MTDDTKITHGLLDKRIADFQGLRLPGQPQFMHMGTLILVLDLWEAVQVLAKQVRNSHTRLTKAEMDWIKTTITQSTDSEESEAMAQRVIKKLDDILTAPDKLALFPQCGGCEYNPCDPDDNSDFCPAYSMSKKV